MSGLAPPHSPSTSSRIAMVTNQLPDGQKIRTGVPEPDFFPEARLGPYVEQVSPRPLLHEGQARGATPGAAVLLPSHSQPRLSARASPPAVRMAPPTPPANSRSTSGPGPLGSTGHAIRSTTRPPTPTGRGTAGPTPPSGWRCGSRSRRVSPEPRSPAAPVPAQRPAPSSPVAPASTPSHEATAAAGTYGSRPRAQGSPPRAAPSDRPRNPGWAGGREGAGARGRDSALKGPGRRRGGPAQRKRAKGRGLKPAQRDGRSREP